MRKALKYFLMLFVFISMITLAACDKATDNSGTKSPDSNTTTDTGSKDYNDPTKDQYTVTFDSAGGSSVDPQKVNKGDKAVEPATPTKPGSEFEGWFFQNEKWVFFGYVVTSDMTLVAHWKELDYDVNISKNIESAGTVTGNGTYHYGDKVILTANTTDGYNFLGWYKSGEATPISTKSTYEFTMTDSGVNFEAKWNYYTMTIEKNDYYAGQVNFTTRYISVGKEIELSATTNDGYNFLGWFKNDSDEPITTETKYKFTMLAEDIKFTAKWSSYYVTVTNENNQAGYSNISNQRISIGKEVKLVATTRDGYNFLGWYDNNDLLVSDNPEYTFTMAANNVELKMKWSSYTLTASRNDSSAGTINFTSSKVSVGKEVKLVATTNDGYNFLGWFKDGAETPTSTEPEYTYVMTAADVTLEARWNYYTVTLTRNDSNAGRVNFTSKKVSVGKTASLVATTNDGYNFLGWFEAGATTPVSIDPNYSFVMVKSDVDLEARWNYYTVTFACENTSISTLSTSTYNTKKVSIGKTVEITCKPFLGYHFVGWYDSNDNEVSTEATLSFTMVDSNISYIAKCEADANMSNYIYTSSLTSCTITEVIDKTATKAIIPSCVTAVSSWVFQNCSSLQGVYIDDLSKWCSIDFSNSYSNPLYHAKKLYLNNNLLTELVIPEDITSVSSTVFYNCTSITKVTIGPNVRSIGSWAFQNCSSLIGVYISDLTKWCSIDFSNSYSNPLYYAKKLYLNNELVSNLVITDEVKSIASSVFYNCTSITKVTIGSNVTSIGAWAFQNCSSIQDVYVNDISKWCTIDFSNSYSNPLYYAKKLYLNDELVTDLVVPDGTTSISSHAFYNCTSITSVTLGTSVRSIGAWAFDNCSSLAIVYYNGTASAWANLNISSGNDYFVNATRHFYSQGLQISGTTLNGMGTCTDTVILIPESIKTISKEAFKDNYDITKVFMPNTLTTIESGAFDGCINLSSVYLNGSIKTIGKNAFNDCKNLNDIYYDGLLEGWLTISFGGTFGANPCCGNHGNLYFKNSLVKNLVIPDNSVINSYAFKACDSIETLIIGDNCTIGVDSFNACQSLKTVIIGKNAQIDDNALYYCNHLESVKINEGCKTIGKYSLNSTSSLIKFYLPLSLVYLKDCSISKYSTIYYSGTEEDWDKVTLGLYVEINKSKIVFNYVY